jgi:hypothetical protein
MFETKNLDFGFIILCPEPNIGLLKGTVRSLDFSHGGCPYVAVVPGSTKPEAIKEMKELCEVYRAKDTITSLMNTGMRHAPSDWNILTIGGTWIRKRLSTRYSRFIEEDSDVLFPIFEKQYDFRRATLNGLCIHKKTFKKAGAFPDKGEIHHCKERWALYATALCKSKFKAILGASIC